jgi:hypothetical protein
MKTWLLIKQLSGERPKEDLQYRVYLFVIVKSRLENKNCLAKLDFHLVE